LTAEISRGLDSERDGAILCIKESIAKL
jgi:hypothetical protein